MNTRPLAVVIAPPRLTEPHFARSGSLIDGKYPSGTSQRIAPVRRSTALSAPHGGGLHGMWLGVHSQSRFMPNGVPRIDPISTPPAARRTSFICSRGKSVITVATRLVGAMISCLCGSTDSALQFDPPIFPGKTSEPLSDGGVKIPSLRSDATNEFAYRFAPGRMPPKKSGLALPVGTNTRSRSASTEKTDQAFAAPTLSEAGIGSHFHRNAPLRAS